jgi:hypothetical protein
MGRESHHAMSVVSQSLMHLSPDDFHFRIDLWDDENKLIEQVIAFVSDLEFARAAYAAAVKAKPGKRITLRQRARVLERSFR